MDAELSLDKYVGSREGVRALLKETSMSRELKRRAERAAAAARSKAPNPEISESIEVKHVPGKDRDRYRVEAKGAAGQRTNYLVSSMDAMRSGR